MRFTDKYFFDKMTEKFNSWKKEAQDSDMDLTVILHSVIDDDKCVQIFFVKKGLEPIEVSLSVNHQITQKAATLEPIAMSFIKIVDELNNLKGNNECA